MKSQSQATAVRANEFRDSGQFCATAAKQKKVFTKKIALNDQKCHAVLKMISLSRRARIRGKIRGKFRHRVFTAVSFLWLVNLLGRNTNADGADMDRRMLRENRS